MNLIPKANVFNIRCEICVQAKKLRKPCKHIDRDSELLELIHSDVCDSNKTSRGCNKYFIIFIDDFSKYCYVYLLKSKDEAFKKFKVYKAEVENQQEKKIKMLRSD